MKPLLCGWRYKWNFELNNLLIYILHLELPGIHYFSKRISQLFYWNEKSKQVSASAIHLTACEWFLLFFSDHFLWQTGKLARCVMFLLPSHHFNYHIRHLKFFVLNDVLCLMMIVYPLHMCFLSFLHNSIGSQMG